ncbi:YheC/YheD family protein [Ammoniphilus sp. CFH 90114]|uniref:YheC/YheD family endospore coat-associated protein n=1 Tax=Ammoniphilus sp. CFH 90114 TaxID=2493665 RepID=UPI00100F8A3B|nr:YheC/YheD family protein [Ammoniphilus sp. CFH 90114]RXT13963.1 YheC/YheD family protein [Ammoniphilus sp. CFH 90114]
MKSRMGILLDHALWKGIPIRRTGHEKISFYNKAANKNNMSILYFSLPNVEISRNRVKGYLWNKGRFRLVKEKIPNVIHNRSMSANPVLFKRLQSLTRGRIIFNQHTRYSKFYIHRLLMNKKSIRKYLPHTMKFNKKHLEHMMDEYDSIYVKPVSSSIGRGIIRIVKDSPTHWKIQAAGMREKKKAAKMYSLLKKKTRAKTYLLQEAIPLAEYKGNPFDIRVSVQKSRNGQWQVTGMVGKVAARGNHVTNVARGGKVKRCEKLFEACGLDVNRTTQAIKKASLKIAEYLGKKLPNLADVGFDIGVDSEGRPYFIEVNGRDLRYSFHHGHLDQQWYKTYENPIRYGKFLLKRKR